MKKNLHYVLPMDLGDFHTISVYTGSEIRNKAEKYLDEVKENKEELRKHVEIGIANYDDMVLCIYDYSTGGIGSVYIYLDWEEEKYVLATELNGNTEDVASYELGQEKALLQGFIETAQEKTLKWAS